MTRHHQAPAHVLTSAAHFPYFQERGEDGGGKVEAE